MAAFDFRLEKVLRVREAIRKEKARDATSAREAMSQSERRIEDLRSKRTVRTPGSERPLTAGELAAVHDLLGLIDQHIEAEEEARDQIEKRLENALRELTRAHGEEKALEILRERAYDEWLTERLASEQKEADEAASRSKSKIQR